MAPSAKKMAATFSSFFKRGAAKSPGSDFDTAPEGQLFDKTKPEVDGDDCLHDCESCTVKYPSKFSIDEKEKLYGHVKGWQTHLLVATGKTDWVRDVEDEKGSVMQAVGKAGAPENGKLMLSASNIPVPHHSSDPYAEPTRCLLLPSFTWIENVSPSTVPDLITHISAAPTNTSPLLLPSANSTNGHSAHTSPVDPTTDPSAPLPTSIPTPSHAPTSIPPILSPTSPLETHPCEHSALILMCSQRTRDARCGQSAPLLKKEFERHLRPLGLYRDSNDARPGGVGVYFISHVGGHKFSANVMVYRRAGVGWEKVGGGGKGVGEGNGVEEEKGEGGMGAGQCIWLARVRPEDCENIVRYTVLRGKVVKPERQLRGGFDREKGLVSW